jgi:hypothetical protein
MRVKGSLFVEFVKTIRANKTGIFDRYLTQEDREIISQRILSNIWYPYETFKHCLTAVCEVIAKNDLEVVKEWGRLYGQAIMTTLYVSILKQGNPLSYINHIGLLVRNFFDFGRVEIVIESETRAVYKIFDFDPEYAPVHYLLNGWIERTTEICGAKKLKCETISKSWAGDDCTSIRFSWAK